MDQEWHLLQGVGAGGNADLVAYLIPYGQYTLDNYQRDPPMTTFI